MRVSFYQLAFLGALSWAVGASSWLTPSLHAQELGGSFVKANLDLPFDAGAGEGEGEDEDAPEIIQFYGQTFEGDGTFVAIDRSGSMQNSGELDIAKREVTRMITEFSDKAYFGIVFFDKQILKYPTSGRAAKANPSMKAGAISWVQTVAGGVGSCCQEGLIAALTFANSAPAKRKVVVYVGDGGGTCKGQNEQTYLTATLAAFKGANFQRAQCNAIGVLEVGASQERFLRSLASSNSGSYTKVTR